MPYCAPQPGTAPIHLTREGLAVVIGTAPELLSHPLSKMHQMD